MQVLVKKGFTVGHVCFSNQKINNFGKVRIECSIDNVFKLTRNNHNKLVEENRQYLKHLTNAVLYLTKQELPLRGHDKGSNSLNKVNNRELLTYFAEMNSVFASRLSNMEGSKQFSGVSTIFIVYNYNMN